jgi:hypothetical protein
MKKIFGLLLIGLAIFCGVNWVRNVTRQQETKSSGSAAYDKGQKMGRYSAPGAIGVIFLWGLRLLLSGDERPAPVRRAAGGALPRPGDPSLRGAQDTYASNPARLRIRAGPWLAANSWATIGSGGFALIGVVVLFIKWPVGLVLIVSAALALFKFVREAKQKFWAGGVCPGVVLSARQNLVAVYSDIAASSNVPRPAIRIVKQPLNRLTPEPAYDGMRVATAALYAGFIKQATWKDFSPEVINCVVQDPEEIARVFNSIQEAEWQALDTLLARLPVTRPGLYRMWGDHLAVDATPWIRRKPVVICLSVLVALAAFAALMNLASWQADKARERREAREAERASRISPAPRAVERQAAAAKPEPATTIPSAAAPAPRPVPTSLELGGKIVTVTNLSGKVYENIKLVRAEPAGIIFMTEGGGGMLPLATLPEEFLFQLGVPTNWPGVTYASRAATAAKRVAGSGFTVGSRVSTQWGGKWISGTIEKVNPGGYTFMVRMDDPKFRNALVFATNQMRLQ